MAAYGALLSLMNLVKQIQNHPRPPISFRTDQIHSLRHKVGFLLDFLENDSRSEAEGRDLDGKIANAIYSAEDIFESYIVDRVLSRSTGQRYEMFCQDLQKVIEDLGVIESEALDIQESRGIEVGKVLNPKYYAGSPASVNRKIPMVGFDDDVLIDTMDRLTAQESARRILPIVGMGGIGKTTLARNVYDNSCTVEHYDVRVWVTISQDYAVREILLGAMSCLGKAGDNDDLSEDEIGIELHKNLWGRRYLVVMDDMWSIEAWERMKFFFPDDDNGSRIVITTRISSLAAHFGSSAIIMNFLDEIDSWDLLSKQVFGQEVCPAELEEIGKKIAKNCGGLPLSIAVVGGLLANKERKPEYWDSFAENLHSIVNLEGDEHCSRILSLTYNHLPIHLKPCFLYMGDFPEDSKIRVWDLIQLWVSEGFLRPIEGKSLEMVARAYIHDLIDRNIILVRERGSDGSVKLCNMHDLLRDFCIREAQRENFFCFSPVNSQEGSRSMRRISFQQRVSTEYNVLPLATRSCVSKFSGVLSPQNLGPLLLLFKTVDKNSDSFDGQNEYSLEDMFRLVNLHYLAIRAYSNSYWLFTSCAPIPWNLQTVIVTGSWMEPVEAPPEFWKMSQLRHIEFDSLLLPDPPKWENGLRLTNLQTLQKIKNFKISEDVVRRIPQVKRLKVFFADVHEGWTHTYGISNIGCLKNLTSLNCKFLPFGVFAELRQNLTFPLSLKKLSLKFSRLSWEDMTKIASLPYLQVLKLRDSSVIGSTWNLVHGEFRSLKFLKIENCRSLTYWRADAAHYPCLERIVLSGLHLLHAILLEIGEIATLKLIEIIHCSDCANESPRRIFTEQKSLGNENDLQIRIHAPSK